MFLAVLCDTAIAAGCFAHFTPTRVRSLRSHVKRYAACLGADPATCPPEVYHLPEDRLRAVVQTHAPRQLSDTYVRNIVADMLALLTVGVERGWLPPVLPPLADWRTKGEARAFDRAYYGRMGDADRSFYALTKRGMSRRRRGQPQVETPEQQQQRVFAERAPDLAKALEAYLTSCLNPFCPRTPKAVKKRPVTAQVVRNAIDQLAGFAVDVYDLPAELLTLRDLCDVPFLQAFIPWWLTRRGRSTGGLRRFLSETRTIAEHWLLDPTLARQISALYDMPGLPDEQPMDDQAPAWLDLEELDAIAEARHPLNARRLLDSAYAREVDHYLKHPGERPPRAYRNKPQGTNLHMMAVWAQHALMLRLLIHRPLRQRNLRELAIRSPRKDEKPWQGIPFVKNLLPQPDGSYRLHFEGVGLKVGTRRGKRRQVKLNVWDESFPRSLTDQLGEWLTLWRPRLIKDPDYPFLFVTRWGDPYNMPTVCRLFERTTWTFTQARPGGPVVINPHRIRSLWWTQMVIAGMDFATLVRIFGDSITVAWQNYTDVDKAHKISSWTRDLAKAIADGTD